MLRRVARGGREGSKAAISSLRQREYSSERLELLALGGTTYTKSAKVGGLSRYQGRSLFCGRGMWLAVSWEGERKKLYDFGCVGAYISRGYNGRRYNI